MTLIVERQEHNLETVDKGLSITDSMSRSEKQN